MGLCEACNTYYITRNKKVPSFGIFFVTCYRFHVTCKGLTEHHAQEYAIASTSRMGGVLPCQMAYFGYCYSPQLKGASFVLWLMPGPKPAMSNLEAVRSARHVLDFGTSTSTSRPSKATGSVTGGGVADAPPSPIIKTPRHISEVFFCERSVCGA